jgi:MbtH protein
MMNPFGDSEAGFLALVNEGKHSLWPEFADVSAGWTVAFSDAARQERVDYVDRH